MNENIFLSTHDELSEVLVHLCAHHQLPATAQTLLAGLPLAAPVLGWELLTRAAAKGGLQSCLMQLPPHRLPQGRLPAIVECIDEDDAETKRPYLLLKIEQDSVELMQANGLPLILPTADFERRYTGRILLAEPREKGFTEKPRQAFGWLLNVIMEQRREYAEVLLAAVFLNVFGLALSLYSMTVYDRVVPNNSTATLIVLTVGVIFVFVFDFLLRTLRGMYLDYAGKKADRKISAHLFSHVQAMSMAARPASTGTLVSELRDFEAIRDFISSLSLSALIDLPFTIIFIAFIFYIGGPLGYVALAAIPMAALLAMVVNRPLRTAMAESMGETARKQALLIETVEGLEGIKMARAEGALQYRWESLVQRSATVALKARLLSLVSVNSSILLQQLASVLVLYFGVKEIADGYMTMGGVIACSILTGRALAPLTQLASLSHGYQQTRVALSSLTQFMQRPKERLENTRYLSGLSMQGDISLRRVSFRHDGQPIPVLENVSCVIRAGERVAILGRMGSGKSTLLRVMAGLYVPESGAVLVDGNDLRQIDPVAWRSNVGFVAQEPSIFSGTLRHNITLGEPSINNDAMLNAARMGGVNAFVSRHHLGYEMQVGERGMRLSGGQRQAVMIARALLHNPGVLIMDEPTSAMDFQAEEQFITRMRDYAKDKTVILVTHKSTLLALVDRLIVMDEGKIVADGPKEEVLRALSRGGKAEVNS